MLWDRIIFLGLHFDYMIKALYMNIQDHKIFIFSVIVPEYVYDFYHDIHIYII